MSFGNHSENGNVLGLSLIHIYYKDDMESQGLIFPKIVGPNNLEYIMDDELSLIHI